MKNLLILIALLWFCVAIQAQNDSTKGCHVYIVDEAAVLKMGIEKLEDACAKKLKTCPVTEFPSFMPSFEEESETNKTFKFPGLNQMIEASVYSTDESLPSASGSDSLLLTIRVGPNKLTKDRADEFSAQAEFAQASMAEAIRVKRYYKLDGKRYLIGLECQFKEIK